jgi:hypothetical protein
MPRFVILDHDHPVPHFDLMLESGEKLRTWRLLGDPSSINTIPAELLGDHRIAYLDYEGPVSGGRGRVCRWDSGDYSVVAESLTELRLALEGTRCLGTAVIVCTDGEWRWRYHGS